MLVKSEGIGGRRMLSSCEAMYKKQGFPFGR